MTLSQSNMEGRTMSHKYITYVLVFASFINIQAQRIIDSKTADLTIQPQPKRIVALNKSILLDNNQKTITIYYTTNEDEKAARYFKRLLEKKFPNVLGIYITHALETVVKGLKINLSISKLDTSFVNNQYYSIDYSEIDQSISISSPSLLGLLYGVVTCSEFFQLTENGLIIKLFNVQDWPSYSRRIFSATPQPEDIENLFDFALQNKIETVALPSRSYPWFEVSQEYEDVLLRIKNWKDAYGGPLVMQRHNIYVGKNIEISNKRDIEDLKEVIETAILQGTESLMICADDTPPFEFAQGYVLTSAKDKEKFAHMAKAHCFLMDEIKNWLQKKKYDCELYYVPAFYTYEDAKYGDMFLYNNTPWQKDAFEPLHRDLNYLGQNMPENVFIIWTGPNVRSRIISKEDLDGWSNNLMGRIPFLWDNTLYSHHAFTSTAIFTAYNNDLPADLSNITAGNGMLINGDINSESMKVAAITANEYLWDPDHYEAEYSLSEAMDKYYGKKLAVLLMKFREVELKLRKQLGERALWFQSDTLWQAIIKTREITSKNPFYYHLNYSRLKALRMQLKNSVPAPVSKQVFHEECLRLTKNREKILDEIKQLSPELFSFLNSIRIKISKTY